MFTGIITDLGKLENVKENKFVFSAENGLCAKLEKGTSISVNGVCLTIEEALAKSFSISVMPETLKKTNLEYLKLGNEVNLELPATFETFLSGHIVQGHVDDVGQILNIKREGNSSLFKIKHKTDLGKYIVDKGSIAVNGISLTVIKTFKNYFIVGIIPYTMENTMLKNAKKGDFVNIETDILAKYMVKLLKKQKS